MIAPPPTAAGEETGLLGEKPAATPDEFAAGPRGDGVIA